jgi:SAM-dependent methyltransferase
VQHVCPIVGRLTESDPTPFARGRWRLVACRETGFVYLPDPPAYDALAEDHAWESSSAAERARRRHEEPVLARLSEGFKHVRRRLFRTRCPFATIARGRLEATRFDGPVRVVDVGCADAGFTLGVARRLEAAGFPLEVIGIEVSRALAARARERLADIGGTALEASALDGLRGLEAGSATVVLMSSFLEHEARPLELLREVRRVLRPGGFAIVKVPNLACWNRALRRGRWCGFRYPDHVNYFTPRTLRLLADNAGLDCQQSLLDRVPLSDNMYAVLVRPAARQAAA